MSEGVIEAAHPLEGDRAIEWSWVVANLRKKNANVLDLGCVQSVLTGIASRLGHQVTAIDMREIEYEMDGVKFIKGDLTKIDLNEMQFDHIMNCSMIEHVGIGGRYGSSDQRDGDLISMKNLSNLLTESGTMILTIPVGRDAVFPQHRIYGHKRLPQLLENYKIQSEEYWKKYDNQKWKKCPRSEALDVIGSDKFYALGLYVLTSAK